MGQIPDDCSIILSVGHGLERVVSRRTKLIGGVGHLLTRRVLHERNHFLLRELAEFGATVRCVETLQLSIWPAHVRLHTQYIQG